MLSRPARPISLYQSRCSRDKAAYFLLHCLISSLRPSYDVSWKGVHVAAVCVNLAACRCAMPPAPKE
eukprot:5759494-Amphidinium_carterae.1